MPCRLTSHRQYALPFGVNDFYLLLSCDDGSYETRGCALRHSLTDMAVVLQGRLLLLCVRDNAAR